MTIFDSLKYTISTPPQAGELEALPRELFIHWIDHYTVKWNSIEEESRYSVSNVTNWMQLVFRNSSRGSIDEVRTDIAALRKLIMDWET